jgi:hypothetical protein
MAGFLDVPTNHTAVVITYDGGGLVGDYLRAAIKYSNEGREVKISGVCRSACVLSLSVPGVCVFPDAIVSMHYATDIEKGLPRAAATEQILQSLPRDIAAAYRPNITKNYTRSATLTGGQLVNLGIRPCKGKNPHERALPKTSIMSE